MKSKEQKRAEAIARGKISFATKYNIRRPSRFTSEQEYLDQFRRKCDRSNNIHSVSTIAVYHDYDTLA